MIHLQCMITTRNKLSHPVDKAQPGKYVQTSYYKFVCRGVHNIERITHTLHKMSRHNEHRPTATRNTVLCVRLK